MKTTVMDLREALEARDLASFLDGYPTLAVEEMQSPSLTLVTQHLLPPILRETVARGMSGAQIVRLYQLVRSGALLVVENDLLEAINERLAPAWREVRGEEVALPPSLVTFKETDEPQAVPRTRPVSPSPGAASATLLHRVVIASSFTIGTAAASDAGGFKKNVCASSQEREFLKAIRAFFPTLRAYPNVTLSTFIDIDSTPLRLSPRHRSFARVAQADVLLCTEDEDPIAVIELDSNYHDRSEAIERDALKDELLDMAGVTLVRVRPDDTRNVRAEDFYSLLTTEADVLDKLRPKRMRPRRNHDMLVPAEEAYQRSEVNA